MIIKILQTLRSNLPLPKFTPQLQTNIIEKVMSLMIGIAILVTAHVLGSYVRSSIYAKANASFDTSALSGTTTEQNKQIKKTQLLFIILGQVAYYAIMILAGLVVLKLLGIEATSIIALLGAAGFTIGLSIQGTLSDISSGVLLSLIQTYTIGDLIELDGVKGRVRDFNLTRTILADIDTNAVITIPNSKISENTIINHTKSEHRRVRLDVKISNKFEEFEILHAKLKEELTKTPGVLVTPKAPVVGVSDMSDVGTVVTMKFFIHKDNYPEVVMPIHSRIRQFLATEKVPLVDPF